MTLWRWLRSVRFEVSLALVLAVGFFFILPIWIAWAYGRGAVGETAEENGLVMLAPGYIVDFAWRLFRFAIVLVITWAVFRWGFPTLERHVDPDDYPLLDREGRRISFFDDFRQMPAAPRAALVIATILAIFLGACILISST